MWYMAEMKAYCTGCRQMGHWLPECPERKPVDNAGLLSTKKEVLSTPLATLGEVAKVVMPKLKGAGRSNYDRLKKWRKEHREEYNSRMREYRKANRVG